MISNTTTGIPEVPPAVFPARERVRVRVRPAVFWILAFPLIIYVSSLWVVRPFPFPYATPFLLIFAPLLVKVPRQYVIDCLSRLRIEFAMLIVMILLSALSLSNSVQPFRSFRVIFPCVIPFMLFAHLMVVGSVSREWLLRVSRLMIVTGVVFSVAPFFVSFGVPPLKSFIFGEYRLKCFFEISIQHTIALSVLLPLLVTEFVLRPKLLEKVALGIVMLLLAYTVFRAGSKTAMSVGFLGALFLFVILKLRSQSLGQTLTMFLGIVGGGVFLWFFGLDLAELMEPETAEKMRRIIEGDLATYHSIQDRRHLWQTAIEQGTAHWMVGSGAGEIILGYPHAHNLVLDYFRGIGLFGAVAIVLLCLRILVRALAKGVMILQGRADDSEKRIFACYVAASVYVLCNQMSDCFGPSTIGLLWTVYLVGVLAERPRIRRGVAVAGRSS